jgi:N-acetylmuramoyl-L-alanine amidase
MKLYIDAGHGGLDPGATGNGLREKDLTLDIALELQSILVNNYENIHVLLSRTEDVTKSLSQRTNEANTWNADFYLAIHINAASNEAAQGYEDYIYTSLPSSSSTSKFRELIHEEVMKLNQLNNRGKKKADFYVLRESTMPAMLSENGFISNKHDASLMKQDSWRKHVALGHANGIVKAFGLKMKPKVETPGTLYKVIAGSFKDRSNAAKRMASLKNKGIEALVVTVEIRGITMYRVQAGAFVSQKNAEDRLQKVINSGITDAFIETEKTNELVPAPANEDTEGYSILGPTYLSPEQMNLFVKSINPNAPELGQFYLTYGEKYGIRGDIAFAQAMKETNYFRFTGTVKAGQNNFAGIGATGPNNLGASFNSTEEGVIAHIQHLYAYATTEMLPVEGQIIDPRFNLVKRGIAPTWPSLNGKWAVPGTNYGESILDIYMRMVISAIENLDDVLKDIQGDIR